MWRSLTQTFASAALLATPALAQTPHAEGAATSSEPARTTGAASLGGEIYAQGGVIVVPGGEPPDSEPPPAPPPASPPPAPTPEPPTRLLPHELERPEDEQAQGFSRLPERRLFLFELALGMNTRLGDAEAFERQERHGAVYAAGLWLNLFERAALGLELEQVGLGQATDQSGANLLSVDYSATTAWLGARFVPLRTREVDAFVALRAGVALQHLSAAGVRQLGSGFEPATSFSCRETASPAAALGAGIGASWGLGPRVRLLGRFDATARRLSDDVLGDCAVGIGSATSLAFGLALAYNFGERVEAPAVPRATRGARALVARRAPLTRDSSATPR